MIARLLALLFAVGLAGAAEAQEVVWGLAGNGCVAADATTKFGRYAVRNPSVQHAPGNVDLIILNCPIPRFDSVETSWNLSVTYQDSTGTGAGASVRARLFRMPLNSASAVLLGKVISDSYGKTGLNTMRSSTFQHTFDFDLDYYWVRVELDRTTTSQTVIFHGIFLSVVTPP